MMKENFTDPQCPYVKGPCTVDSGYSPEYSVLQLKQAFLDHQPGFYPYDPLVKPPYKASEEHPLNINDKKLFSLGHNIRSSEEQLQQSRQWGRNKCIQCQNNTGEVVTQVIEARQNRTKVINEAIKRSQERLLGPPGALELTPEGDRAEVARVFISTLDPDAIAATLARVTDSLVAKEKFIKEELIR